jgi:hypothetical protein
MNKELAEKRIVNVLLVIFVKKCYPTIKCYFLPGIKQTEAEKYPLKGYLAIREGDILCIPHNNSGMAKHMADVVR